jgi:two-component system chemotaxis response regulator CheB
MRSTIRVLVVDDSALVRQMLTRVLRLDPRIEVVGIARNGVEAIEKARDLDPDVITLDIEMPELNGLEALPHIARHSRARVVMLSSLDDPDITYQALQGGAVDFISKPTDGVATSLNDLAELLIKKIKTAYRLDPGHVDETVAALRADVAGDVAAGFRGADQPSVPAQEDVNGGLKRIVAIAASTGGPPALERVFSGLDRGLSATYLIVQHLPAGFSASLARRLTVASTIEVVQAQDGMRLEVGRGYIAPYGSHMKVAGTDANHYVISLDEEAPAIHGVKPAADPLFESVAALFGARAMGVVLTGMGSDGARGLYSIREAGGDAVAQDEDTSVIWGMPGAAVRIGAARRCAPIGLIAPEIRRFVRGGVSDE